MAKKYGLEEESRFDQKMRSPPSQANQPVKDFSDHSTTTYLTRSFLQHSEAPTRLLDRSQSHLVLNNHFEKKSQVGVDSLKHYSSKKQQHFKGAVSTVTDPKKDHQCSLLGKNQSHASIHSNPLKLCHSEMGLSRIGSGDRERSGSNARIKNIAHTKVDKLVQRLFQE